MQHLISIDGALHHVWLSRTDRGYALDMDGGQWPVALTGHSVLHFNGMAIPLTVVVEGDRIHVHINGTAHELVIHDPIVFHRAEAGGEIHNSVRAPMPGSVIATAVSAGDMVAEGDTLMVIESMKLQTSIRAPHACVVEAIHFASGQSFERDAVLVTFVMPQG